MNVSTDLNFHFVHRVSASSPYTDGAPLVLNISGTEGIPSRCVIFTDDAEYTQALIDAINSVQRTPKLEAA